MLKIKTLLDFLIVNLWLRIATLRWRGVIIGYGGWIKSPFFIADGTHIGWGFCVRGLAPLIIGRHNAIGENVRVITSNHEPSFPFCNFNLQKKLWGRTFPSDRLGVTIGHNIWIGDGVIVLPGVNIANGAIIGAGSVVTRDVPPYAIVAGSPARFIKTRLSKNNIDFLESTEWWTWPEKKLRESRESLLQYYTEISADSNIDSSPRSVEKTEFIVNIPTPLDGSVDSG